VSAVLSGCCYRHIARVLSIVDGVSEKVFNLVAIIVTITALNIRFVSQKAQEITFLNVILATFITTAYLTAASTTSLSRNDTKMHSHNEDLFAQKISSADFRRIRSLIYQHTAIVVPDEKKDFIRSRILKRMRQIKVTTLSQYCDFVESGEEPIGDFASQVTTNHTHFFRESHHFDTLVEHLRQSGCDNKVIWSAACSSGEEPYSIALTIREKFPTAWNGSIKIIASDIDEKVLEQARRGVFGENKIEVLSRAQKSMGFMRGKNEMLGTVKTKSWMRSMVEFRQTNLMDPLPLSGNVDVIFCRNVVIYFDHQSKVKLFSKFADLQKSGDLLLIGHSESLNGICSAYQCLGSTVYKRL